MRRKEPLMRGSPRPPRPHLNNLSKMLRQRPELLRVEDTLAQDSEKVVDHLFFGLCRQVG